MTLVYTNSFFRIWLFFFDLRIISEIVLIHNTGKMRRGLFMLGDNVGPYKRPVFGVKKRLLVSGATLMMLGMAPDVRRMMLNICRRWLWERPMTQVVKTGPEIPKTGNGLLM